MPDDRQRVVDRNKVWLGDCGANRYNSQLYAVYAVNPNNEIIDQIWHKWKVALY